MQQCVLLKPLEESPTVTFVLLLFIPLRLRLQLIMVTMRMILLLHPKTFARDESCSSWQVLRQDGRLDIGKQSAEAS